MDENAKPSHFPVHTGGPEAVPEPGAPLAGPSIPAASQSPSPSSVVIPSQGGDMVPPPASIATQDPVDTGTPPVPVNPPGMTSLVPSSQPGPPPPPPATTTSKRRTGGRPQWTGRPGGNNLIATSPDNPATGNGPATETSSQTQQCARKRQAQARRRAARSYL